MKMCLHMHSLKLAHTFTHKKTPICSQSHTRTFPQIQHNHKEHHTHMLTDEYAHTYHEVHTFTYTHRCSNIFICTHLHINSEKYTPLSCALTCIHSHTHMNILTFMPMVKNSLIHKKSPIHFPPENSYLSRHPRSLSHVLMYMHMVRFTCSKMFTHSFAQKTAHTFTWMCWKLNHSHAYIHTLIFTHIHINMLRSRNVFTHIKKLERDYLFPVIGIDFLSQQITSWNKPKTLMLLVGPGQWAWVNLPLPTWEVLTKSKGLKGYGLS